LKTNKIKLTCRPTTMLRRLAAVDDPQLQTGAACLLFFDSCAPAQKLALPDDVRQRLEPLIHGAWIGMRGSIRPEYEARLKNVLLKVGYPAGALKDRLKCDQQVYDRILRNAETEDPLDDERPRPQLSPFPVALPPDLERTVGRFDL